MARNVPISRDRIILVAGIVLALLLFLLPSASAQTAPGLSIAPGLAKASSEVLGHLGAAGPADLVPLIVETVADPSDAHMTRLVGLGGLLKARFSVIHGYAAQVPAAAVEALGEDPEVDHISYDSPVKSHLDVAYGAVKADLAFSDFGLQGSGVGVAIVDTGVAWHQDLVRYGSNNTNVTEIEIVGHEGGLADYFGHGTHVAGIIAGNGAASTGGQYYRTFKGVAPNVNIYSVRALYPDGTGYTSDVLAGVNWVIGAKAAYNIRVLNLSLGHPVYESYTTDPLCKAARAAYDAGILVVVAAGNDGKIGSGFGTITSPGNEPSTLTVGAMDDARTVTTTDDTLAPYSSKGPTLVDHVVKPDLVAPGTRIVSLRDPGSYLDTNYHSYTLQLGDYSRPTNNSQDGVYYTLSGTSMAAPFVSGAAALLFRKDPSLNPATVKARLMQSAVKDTALIFQTGAGELDIDAALKATGYAASAMSPLSSLGSDGYVYMQNLSLIWGVDWTTLSVYGALKGTAYGVPLTSVSGLSLIWGVDGVLCGTSSLIWNDAITASSLIWGIDGCSQTSTTGMVSNESAVWGGNGHH
jgi:serine protease AprX